MIIFIPFTLIVFYFLIDFHYYRVYMPQIELLKNENKRLRNEISRKNKELIFDFEFSKN